MTSTKGRKPIAPPTLVEKIAVEMVKQWCSENPKALRLALVKNPNYLATLAKSERTLKQAAIVRHGLVVDRWIEERKARGQESTPDDINYLMFLAARPSRGANAKSYAREEADESWEKATRLRIQSYKAGGAPLYFARWALYTLARGRVEGTSPPLDGSKLATVVRPEKQARKPRKLLPEVTDTHGEDDWI